MAEFTEAQVIAELAERQTEPKPISRGGIYSLIVPAGAEQVELDLAGPNYTPRPDRKTGTVKVLDASSLIRYLAKHGTPATEVWADRTGPALVAVINAHDTDAAGWGDHRAEYAVRTTDAWKAWASIDGKLLNQSAFAEHIEARAVDIVKPSGADMLELAQSISATIGVKFESSKLLSSGERQIEYRETVDAKAGRAGTLEIPSVIELALKPFEGAPAYKVRARFRYRLNDGALLLGVALERPEDVVAEAFDEVVKTVADAIDHDVFAGSPSCP